MTAYNHPDHNQIHCPACAAAAARSVSSQGTEIEHNAINSGPSSSGQGKKRRGLIGRWLDRLSKANQQEFGNSGPTCCH